MANNVLAGLWIFTKNGWDIQWGWQEIGNKIEDFLNDHTATITTGNQEELAIDNALAKCGLKFVFGDCVFAFVEELFHERFISLDSFLDEH